MLTVFIMPTICHLCGKEFKYSFSLNRHLREHHDQFTVYNKRKNNFKCVICNECCENNKHFSDHVFEKHKIDIKKESFEFTNSVEFYSWKNKIEDEESSFYSKSRIKQQPKNSTTIYFNCNRRGFYKSEITKPEKKKKLKAQGTVKISGYCPAGIKAIFKEDESVIVEYTSTHVGHSQDLAHLPLKLDLRKNIAEKIAMKIPFNDILNEIRSSKTDNTIKREHLITKNDLYNIKKEFSIGKDDVHKSNDAENINALVKEDKASENNCIIVYDPDNVGAEGLDEEDFILEIMPCVQFEEDEGILQEVGSIVEIDSIDEQKQLIEAKFKSILNKVSTSEGVAIVNKTLDSLTSQLNELEQGHVEQKTEILPSHRYNQLQGFKEKSIQNSKKEASLKIAMKALITPQSCSSN